MTPATTDLARRAVSAEAFRWMRGMTYVLPCGERGVMTDDGWVINDGREDALRTSETRGWPAAVPDLDDPATRGCLLELVRERVGTEVVYIERSTHRIQVGVLLVERDLWVCVSDGDWAGPASDTRTEALVAALEAV